MSSAHQLPSPLPDPPREVIPRAWDGAHPYWFDRAFSMPHLLAGVFVAGLALFFLLAAVFSSVTPGEVTGVYADTSRRSQTTHHAVYHAGDGEARIEGSAVISPERFDEWSRQLRPRPATQPAAPTPSSRPARVTIPVSVAHFELGPFRGHRIVGEEQGFWATAGLVGLFAAVWNAFVAMLIGKIWWTPWMLRQLVRRGIAFRGRVTRARSSSGRTTHYFVSYSFVDGAGAERSGETECLEKSLWETAAADMPVTILVDPERPDRHTLYEFCPYRVR